MTESGEQKIGREVGAGAGAEAEAGARAEAGAEVGVGVAAGLRRLKPHNQRCETPHGHALFGHDNNC